MNKTVVIVVALAAVVLVGVAGLMVLKPGGAEPTSTPPPPSPALAPGDMREHNRKQIGEMLDASRERGDEARRLSTGTQPTASTHPSTTPSPK